MKHESKKITLIVNELLTMLLLEDAKDINIQVKKDEGCTTIHFVQYDCDYTKAFIDQLQYDLNTQRQNEVEGYYWQLVGKDDVGDELHLVGAMIDEAHVNFEDRILNIDLERKCKSKNNR